MRLKSFYGPNLTEAMNAVRQALGDNAIIVATRDDEGGGVRVTAAIDDVVKAATAPPETAGSFASDTLDAASVEIIEVLAKTLLQHNVPNALAERLLATATQFVGDEPTLALGSALDMHLTFQPLGDDKPGKPLVLIGPPGVGKTLCTAKLATKARMAHRKVAVIGTDVERAGGMEQLAAFTRLLEIDLIEIEDAPSLHEALLLQQPDTHIFVDTAGCNPFDPVQKEQTRALVKATGGDAVLVLPADMDAAEAIDMLEAFRSIGAKSLLITRLDLTRRLGGMLRLAYETKMALATFCASSKVTEPPLTLNPISLARLILPKERESDNKQKSTDAA